MNLLNNLTMLLKYSEAMNLIDEVKFEVHVAKEAKEAKKSRTAHNPEAIENPGDALEATDGALDDMKEILDYFKENFLDANGDLIKISFFRWVFEKKYRQKIGGMIEFVFDKIKDIVSRFKK